MYHLLYLVMCFGMLQGAFSQPPAPSVPAGDDGIPQWKAPLEKRTDSGSYGSYGPPGSYSSSDYSDAFHCDNDAITHQAYVCDGDNDCYDCSDELGIGCDMDCEIGFWNPGYYGPYAPYSSYGSYGSDDSGVFQCDNGNTTSAGYVCDGDNDCYDCSDELGIGCEMDCEIGFWNPGYYGPYAPYSSYGSYGSDDSGVFQCGNGNTTSAGYVCDGDNDCYDCSDELGIGCELDCEIGFWNPGYYGPYAPYSSYGSYGSNNSGVFQCDNGNTTSAGYVCDGDNDCYDCSDELGIGCEMDCEIGFWNPGYYGPYAPYSSYGSDGSYSGSFIFKKK